MTQKGSSPLLESAVLIARSGDIFAGRPNNLTRIDPVTAATVVEWFRGAFNNKTILNESSVKTLVGWLNSADPWDNDKAAELTKRTQKFSNLSRAIKTILEIAPEFLEEHKRQSELIVGEDFVGRMGREWHDKRANVLRELLMGANAATLQYPPGTGMKKRPYWTLTAQTAAAFIAAAMLQAKHECPNFNDGPALRVLQRAMCHVEGKERKLTTLREAFRGKNTG